MDSLMALESFSLKMDHTSMELSQMGSSMARAASSPKTNPIMKVKFGIIWPKAEVSMSAIRKNIGIMGNG